MKLPSEAMRTGMAGECKESRIAARGYYTSVIVVCDQDGARRYTIGERAGIADKLPASRIRIVTLSMFH
jgi:hypothetical protein